MLTECFLTVKPVAFLEVKFLRGEPTEHFDGTRLQTLNIY